MSSVKEAAYIHCGVKIGIFKPEEITRFSYMHSRGFFTCPGSGVKVFHKRQNGQPTFVVTSTNNHANNCLYNE